MRRFLSICLDIALAVLAIVAQLLFTPIARAETIAPSPQLGFKITAWNVTFQPAAAVGVQLNLKTGELNRAAVLVGFAGTWNGPLALGAGIYCGLGSATSGPTAGQCNVLLSVANFGALGIGVQEYKSPITGQAIYQGLLTFAGNLNFGGTPSYFKAETLKAAAR